MESGSVYSKLKRQLLMFIIAHSPKATIRRIYIGALCGLLLKIHNFDCTKLTAANKRLKFTEDVQVLRFYKWAYNLLWKNNILSSKISIGEREIVLDDVAVEQLTSDELHYITKWLVDNVDEKFKEIAKDHKIEKSLPEDTQTIILSAFEKAHIHSV